MKSFSKFIILFFLARMIFFTLTVNAQQDIQAQVCISNYIEGVTKGNQKKFNISMYEAATFKYIDIKTQAIKVMTLTLKAVERKSENPKDFKVHFSGIDVSGTTAQAKVSYDYPGRKYTDYYNLLKVNGDWKIVDVICYTENN